MDNYCVWPYTATSLQVSDKIENGKEAGGSSSGKIDQAP